jgi:hypothetical protein
MENISRRITIQGGGGPGINTRPYSKTLKCQAPTLYKDGIGRPVWANSSMRLHLQNNQSKMVWSCGST